jgi:hypothetical protein
MKKSTEAAYKKLQALNCPVFVRGDENEYSSVEFYISGEDEESYLWVDYYGEFRGGDSYVSPKIERILERHNLEYDWENPGCICIFPA